MNKTNSEIITEGKKGYRDVKIYYDGELHEHSERSEGNEIKDIKVIADGINLFDKARASGLPSKSRDEANAYVRGKEAGRQFALAEIEMLKKELSQIRDCVKKLKKQNSNSHLCDFEIDKIFPDCAEQPKLNLKMTDKEVKEAKKGYKEFFGEEPKTAQPVCKNCGKTKDKHHFYETKGYFCYPQYNDVFMNPTQKFEPKTEQKK